MRPIARWWPLVVVALLPASGVPLDTGLLAACAPFLGLGATLVALLVLPVVACAESRGRHAGLGDFGIGALPALAGATALFTGLLAAGIAPVGAARVVTATAAIVSALLLLRRHVVPSSWTWRDSLFLLILVLALFLAAWPLVSPRVFESWHGNFHASLIERVLAGDLPPENPGMAGEMIPYHWGFHLVPALVASASGAAPLTALFALNVVWIAVAALAMVEVMRPFLAAERMRRVAPLAPLALFGSINTAGPFLLLAKRLWHGELPANEFDRGEWIDWLAQRAIPGNDYNVTRTWWDVRASSFLKEFLDASAMATGLVAVLAALAIAVQALDRRRSRGAIWLLPLLVFASAIVYPQLQPVVLAEAGLACLLLAWTRSPERGLSTSLKERVALALALAGSLALALPYLQSITDTSRFSTGATVEPFVSVAFRARSLKALAAFAALLPLMIPGILALSRRRAEPAARAVLSLAFPLLALICGVRMQQGTEYKYLYAAAPLATLVALIGLEWWLDRWTGGRRRALYFAALLCFAGPPALFIVGALASDHFHDPRPWYERLDGAALDGATWRDALAGIRDDTPDATVVVAPLLRSRKSPNNDGFAVPATCDRVLWLVDDSQLTRRLADYPRRAAVVEALVDGGDFAFAVGELKKLDRSVALVVSKEVGRSLLARPGEKWRYVGPWKELRETRPWSVVLFEP